MHFFKLMFIFYEELNLTSLSYNFLLVAGIFFILLSMKCNVISYFKSHYQKLKKLS